MPNDAESGRAEAREAERKWYSSSLAHLRGSGAVGVVAVTAILYSVVISGRLAFHHWDPTFFVCMGSLFCDQSPSPQTLTVRSHIG
jgi:hypothetical protein